MVSDRLVLTGSYNAAHMSDHPLYTDTAEMDKVYAYVLINTEVGSSLPVIEALKGVSCVTRISSVTGTKDLIVLIAAQCLNELHDAVEDIHMIAGIEETETQVVLKQV